MPSPEEDTALQRSLTTQDEGCSTLSETQDLPCCLNRTQLRLHDTTGPKLAEDSLWIASALEIPSLHLLYTEVHSTPEDQSIHKCNLG